MTYSCELIERKYLHNTPLSDSLPIVRVFWGYPVTPSNGGLRNTLLGVVEEWTFKHRKQLFWNTPFLTV